MATVLLSSGVFIAGDEPSHEMVGILSLDGDTGSVIEAGYNGEDGLFVVAKDTDGWYLAACGVIQESPVQSYNADVYVRCIDNGVEYDTIAHFDVIGFREGIQESVAVTYIDGIASRIGTHPKVTLHGRNFDTAMSVFLYGPDGVCRKPADSDLSWNLTDTEDNLVEFVLTDDLLSISDNTELCGVYEIYVGVGSCTSPVLLAGSNDRSTQYFNRLGLIRYSFDSTNAASTSTSAYGTTSPCYSVPDMSLVYDPVGEDGTMLSDGGASGKYGKTMYYRRCPDTDCKSIRYFAIALKYNSFLPLMRGEMTLDGVSLHAGDIVWLAAQNDGTDGLWVVSEDDWVGLSDLISGGEVPDVCDGGTTPLPVDCTVFIDLGVRVTEKVDRTISTYVEPYGLQYVGGARLSAGMVVALTSQGDGTDGIYRVTCAEWIKVGDIYSVSGGGYDMTPDVIYQNDIDFCSSGVYHIDYYYLNGSCYLAHRRRTVKIIGAGGIVPNSASKQVAISDYLVRSGVDSDLVASTGTVPGDPVAEDCIRKTVDSFDNEHLAKTSVTSNCGTGMTLVSPDGRTICVCEQYYNVYQDGGSSRDKQSFTIMFWHIDDDGWNLYAYIGENVMGKANYYVYRLNTDGIAKVDDIMVNSEAEVIDSAGHTIRSQDAWFTEHNGKLCPEFSIIDDSWEFAVKDIDGNIVGYTHTLDASNLYQSWSIRCTTVIMGRRDYDDEKYSSAMRTTCEDMHDAVKTELAKRYTGGAIGIYGFKYYDTAITKERMVAVYNAADAHADSLACAVMSDEGFEIRTDSGERLQIDGCGLLRVYGIIDDRDRNIVTEENDEFIGVNP